MKFESRKRRRQPASDVERLSVRRAAKRLTQFSCLVSQERHAFGLAILPHFDPEEAEPDYAELTDPYWGCPESPHCGCQFEVGNQMWKIEGACPGGLFRGRVLETTAPPYSVPCYEIEVCRPLDLKGPHSAYAVITPDGVWHECAEPEPHDLFVGDPRGVRWTNLLEPDRQLSPLQIAWRFTVDEFLTRYQHLWVLGMDLELTRTPPARCVSGMCAGQPCERERTSRPDGRS